MWTWLGKLDPNTIAALFTMIGSFGLWLYHDLKGDKVESLDDKLRGLGKQVIHLLLTDASIGINTDPAILKAKADALLWSLADRIGVPRNPLTEGIASTLLEHIIGDTMTQLRAMDTIPTQLTAIAATAKTTVNMLKDMPDPKGFEGEVGPDLKAVVTKPGEIPILRKP